jgi:NADPH:quinone reductase-like Zn-dependent oxidoreductase
VWGIGRHLLGSQIFDYWRDGTVPLDVKRLYMNQITIIGTFGKVQAADVELGLRAAAEGRYRVLIDRVMPLADAPLAHRIVEQRSGTGKVILQP